MIKEKHAQLKKDIGLKLEQLSQKRIEAGDDDRKYSFRKAIQDFATEQYKRTKTFDDKSEFIKKVDANFKKYRSRATEGSVSELKRLYDFLILTEGIQIPPAPLIPIKEHTLLPNTLVKYLRRKSKEMDGHLST